MELQLGTGELPKDITQMGLSGRFSAFRYDSKYAINADDEAVPAVDIRKMDSYVVNLMVRHYFGAGWSADVNIPTGTIKIQTEAPEGEEPNDPSYMSGFGDAVISTRYDFSALWGPGSFRPSLALTAGLGLPTGTSEIFTNPGFSGNLLALGYGVFSGRVRLDFAQSLHKRFAVKLYGQLTKPLSYTDQGLKYGLSVGYGLGIIWRAADWLSVTARGAGQHLEPNFMLTADEENPNSGGDVLAAELDLAFKATDRFYTGVSARVPFWEDLNFDGTSTQLVERFSGQLYVAVVFGAEEEE